MAVSIAALAVRGFGVSIQKLPIGGWSISFEAGLLGFLLVISLIYFLVSFVLYYYIDIKNFEVTKHQDDVKREAQRGPHSYRRQSRDRMVDEIESVLPEGVSLTRSLVEEQIERFAEHAGPMRLIGLGRHAKIYFHLARSSYSAGGTSHISLDSATRENSPELWAKIDRIASRYLRSYWWRVRFQDLRYQQMHLRVSWTYLLRNYFVDGMLPILIAAFALTALFDLVDVRWLRSLSPLNIP